MSGSDLPRVVLDLAGGDFGYAVNLEALRILSRESDLPFDIIAVGNPELDEWNFDFELVNSCDNDPVKVGLELVRDGVAQAFVSVGDTSKVVSRAAFILGRVENISRPAIIAMFPTIHREPAIVIDVGATPSANAQNLVDFALMSVVYAENVLGWNSPRVALLSIGEESKKGTPEIREAGATLTSILPNFIGNAEGRDIIHRRSDIFVCEGLVGNILLKFFESMRDFFRVAFHRAKNKDLRSKFGGTLLEPSIRSILTEFDYATYGGAPLLGVNGVCIIGHGRSTPQAVRNAVHLAAKISSTGIVEKIKELSTI